MNIIRKNKQDYSEFYILVKGALFEREHTKGIWMKTEMVALLSTEDLKANAINLESGVWGLVDLKETVKTVKHELIIG